MLMQSLTKLWVARTTRTKTELDVKLMLKVVFWLRLGTKKEKLASSKPHQKVVRKEVSNQTKVEKNSTKSADDICD